MSLASEELQTLPLDGFALGEAPALPEAQISYRCIGELDRRASNCVLLFSYYTGTDLSYEPWIGPGRAIDPERHFVVAVNHFGGGVSSSPSNTPDGDFSRLSVADCARAAMIVLDHLGVRRVRLAAGWSLGGLQALEFAAQHRGSVEQVLALCSAARCGPINGVFLDSVGAALEADPRFPLADPARPPLAGLDAFGRVYAGWAYAEEFFDDEIYTEFGYGSPDDVVASWGEDHRAMHAGDLMASLGMWRRADLGRGRGGLDAALGALTARTVLMPSTTDRYFTLAENRRTATALAHGELVPLISPLGHVAGRPGVRDQEHAQVEACLRRLLSGEAGDPGTIE